MRATAAGAVRHEGGQPVRRFTKELIRCGQYLKEADSLRFEVTPETLKHWATTCAAFLSAGNKIPVPVTHTDDPAANRGWVVDVWEDGKSLFGAIDLVGDEAIKLAGTTDVSIYSPAEHVDGHGNRYRRPILHVALCTDPVIPGLGGFVPIQSSQQKTPVQVPVLKLQEATMPDDTLPAADPAAPASTPGDAIREAIKQQVIAILDDDTIDDAAAFKKIKDLFKARAKALGVLETLDAGEPAPAAGEPAADPAMSASRGGAAPDPFVLKLARDSYAGKLDRLVAAGKIAPAVRDALRTQYLSDAALSLSLRAKNTDHLDGLLAALDKNPAHVAAGEKTGPQALALSRNIPVGDEQAKSRKEAGDELRAMTARAAGLKPAK